MTPPAAPVRRSWEPLLLAILIVGSSIALIMFDSTPFATDLGYALLSMAIVLLIWTVVGVWSGVLLMRFVRQRPWNLSIAWGILLAAMILAIYGFFPYMRGCHYLGGAIRFAANREYYDQQVSLLPADDKPRIEVFDWGGMIWASSGLVYDESDEIALPSGEQSARWKDKARSSQLSCGNWDARHLWSHYYLVAFPC